MWDVKNGGGVPRCVNIGIYSLIFFARAKKALFIYLWAEFGFWGGFVARIHFNDN